MQSTARGLLLALAYLLAACGSGGASAAPPTVGPVASATPVAAPTQPAPPTAAAAAPTASIPPTAIPTPTTTNQADAANLLISYHKTGGIAGVNEMLTVYTDGTIELRNRKGTITTQATPSDIQVLQKLLASPEFATLHVPGWPPGADQFFYELTVAGRVQPIVTTDSAENPPVLRELIGALEQLKKQAK